MAKSKTPVAVPVEENEITEIIELAANDLEALARAFNLIAEVCEGRESPRIVLDAPHSRLN